MISKIHVHTGSNHVNRMWRNLPMRTLMLTPLSSHAQNSAHEVDTYMYMYIQ